MLRGIASVAPTCNELFSLATRTEHTRDTGRAPRSAVPFLHLRTGAQVPVPASEPSLPLACGLPRMIWIPVCFVLSLSRLFFPRLIAYSHFAIRSPRLSRISNSSFPALRYGPGGRPRSRPRYLCPVYHLAPFFMSYHVSKESCKANY